MATTRNAGSRTAYQVRGTTDEVTECQICGKPELKGTVILDILDADGNTGDITYAGTTCAGRLVRTPAKRIRQQAEAADYTAARRLEWAQEKIAAFAPAEHDDALLAETYLARNAFARRNCWTPAKAAADARQFLATAREMLAARGLVQPASDWPL
jgi:hypothetical protein